MKIISDIITELVDSEKPLMNPLLKTKVLASRINNTELLTWTNQEISGYKDHGKLPDYRVLKCSVIGTFINGNYQFNDQPIATAGLSEEIVTMLNTMNFDQSISTLESFPKQGKDTESGRLERTLAPEITFMLTKNIQKLGNPFLNIISTKQIISIEEINQVIGSVRSKLLDLMLELDKEYGDVTDLNDLTKKSKEINEKVTKIMKKTIIKAGDGNVINTGDKSTVKGKIKIKKDSFDDLRKELKGNGVAENDIDELQSIITKESPDHNGYFGKKVNAWIQKMIGKSLDGTWQIGVGAAGNLLAESIKSYYGL